jgi:hypothetical protein
MSEIHPLPALEGLIEGYGLVVGGKDLMRLLGFKNYKSFHSACTTNRLPVSVFEIPGRKGKFAKTQDLARWYEQLGG